MSVIQPKAEVVCEAFVNPFRACAGVGGGQFGDGTAIAGDNSFTQRPAAVMLVTETRRNHGQRMSAMPPKAEVAKRRWHSRFVPKGDIGAKRKSRPAQSIKSATGGQWRATLDGPPPSSQITPVYGARLLPAEKSQPLRAVVKPAMVLSIQLTPVEFV